MQVSPAVTHIPAVVCFSADGGGRFYVAKHMKEFWRSVGETLILKNNQIRIGMKHIILPDKEDRRLIFYLAMEEFVARELDEPEAFFCGKWRRPSSSDATS